MRQTKAPSQNSRQAPPTSRERRTLRLPLSQQEEASFLSWQEKLLTISSSSEDGKELTKAPLTSKEEMPSTSSSTRRD